MEAESTVERQCCRIGDLTKGPQAVWQCRSALYIWESRRWVRRIFLVLPLTRSWVARTGLRLRTVYATGHYLPLPGQPPVEIPSLDHPEGIMRWVAHHSLIVAEKL